MKNIFLYCLCAILFSFELMAQSGKAVTESLPQIISSNSLKEDPISFTHSNAYTYSDSVIELKWDTTKPVGYLPGLSQFDTICVTFNGIIGGKLDSIKIAVQYPGSIVGGVWQFNSSFKPSPLGQPLAVPITATITTSSKYPYPVPFQNWAKVDLSTLKIKTDSAFAVGFAIGKDSVKPGIIVSKMPSKTSYHNFTYYGTGHNKQGWYYLTAGQDSVYIYLIRAYVSLQPATAVRDKDEIANRFSLSQNYPNPFNPETIIKYSVAQEGKVNIKVFNLLGESVAVLINKIQQAGDYSVNFRPSEVALPSGIYFYSIEVNSLKGNSLFTSVKKMAYIK